MTYTVLVLASLKKSNIYIYIYIYIYKAISRKTLLNNERNSRVDDRLVLNPTYHLLLRDFKVLNEAQILLMLNEENTKLFLERSLP